MATCTRRALLSLLSLLLLTVSVRPARAQTVGPGTGGAGTQRAGLVVRFADGKVQTACVSFAEPSLSGEQLLQRSGFKTIVDSGGAIGGAICSINDQGCRYPSEDCFCHCTGSQCEYWAYYLRQGSAWEYSQTGAGALRVSDGDLQGWSWGPGNFSSGTEPPAVAFADVCPAGAVASPVAQTAATTPAPAAGSGALLQYAAYAALALVLLGAGAFVLLRRRV